MKIVQPSVEFIAATPNIGQVIELGARNCYKSEDKIGEGTDERLFNQIVKQTHHESVAEHGFITVRIITDRAMLAQITRHRTFGFSVESQRYCNYSKKKFGNDVQFIKPFDLVDGSLEYVLWKACVKTCEDYYFKLISLQVKPETARSVLPNSAKTEIVMSGNIRAWRHFFELRQAGHAQSDVQHLVKLIYEAFMDNDIPDYLFNDIIKN
jgi:thymidylate synthase (FAD)